MEYSELFVPISFEFWCVKEREDGYLCERVIGFVQNQDSDGDIYWFPAKLEFGVVVTIDYGKDYEFFWHKPSFEEIHEVFSQRDTDDGMRNQENFMWFDKNKKGGITHDGKNSNGN